YLAQLGCVRAGRSSRSKKREKKRSASDCFSSGSGNESRLSGTKSFAPWQSGILLQDPFDDPAGEGLGIVLTSVMTCNWTVDRGRKELPVNSNQCTCASSRASLAISSSRADRGP